MKGIFSWWKLSALILLGCVAGSAALAQRPGPDHFTGVINDYPVSLSSSGVTVWELRGPWSLDLHGDSGRADFSAALTMEYSDIYLGSVAAATSDSRHQHTHTITMKDATTMESTGDCPSGITPYPTYTWLFEVTGMADVTGNGGSPFGGPVPLQVCIGGCPDLHDITMVFKNLPDDAPSPATSHFGIQPIHGVISGVRLRNRDAHER